MTEQVAQDFRVLKTVVIVLGLLLVIGFVVLAATLIVRAGKLGAAAGADSVALTLAPEVRIVDMALGQGALAVRTEGPAGEIILIVDLRRGEVVKSVRVERE